jgi:uncharacterized membrane protein
MTGFILGLILFLGAHSISIVAPSWRDRMVERIGLRTWQGVYAVISIIGLVLIVRGYSDLRNQTAFLYILPRWVHAISMVLMLPVFPLLLASYFRGGIQTLARHPTLVAVKLWALAHLLANGSVVDILLFGSVLFWAVVDRISLKSRPVRTIAAAKPGQWNDLIVVIGGLMLYSMMVQFGHRLLIGMPLVLR